MTKPLLVALLQVRIYLKDRADLAFSLLLPIAIFALGYGAFGGSTQFHGTAHIVNQDQGGAYSVQFIEQLEDIDGLSVELLSETKADSKLDRADILMAVYIPEDFSRKLAAGERTELIFRQRGNGGDEGQIVASIVSGVVGRLSQEFQVRDQVSDILAESGIGQSSIDIKVRELLEDERESPAVSVQEDIEGGSTDIVDELMPGILTMFVLFAITLSARAIVEERKKGTLERLLTTQLSVGQLFTGKFLVNFSRGFIQTLILLLLSYAVFQMFTPLSFIESLVVAIIFIAAVSALGLLIASVSRTEDQATWIAVFFTMAMVLLSGTFFEIPESGALHALSKISVNTYALESFKTIIRDGSSLADVSLNLGVMAAVAVVGLFISRILFKVVPGGR